MLGRAVHTTGHFQGRKQLFQGQASQEIGQLCWRQRFLKGPRLLAIGRPAGFLQPGHYQLAAAQAGTRLRIIAVVFRPLQHASSCQAALGNSAVKQTLSQG